MAQFQLPQFIETEDKLMGALTFKQFGILGGVGGGLAVMYFILTPLVWFIIAIPIFAGTLAVAFIKINGQPLSRIATGAFRYYWFPQVYVWQPDQPNLPKQAATAESEEGSSLLEKIVAGAALKSAMQEVQTGSKAPVETAKQSMQMMRDRYEVFQRITGERKAAKRVDYR